MVTYYKVRFKITQEKNTFFSGKIYDLEGYLEDLAPLKYLLLSEVNEIVRLGTFGG